MADNGYDYGGDIPSYGSPSDYNTADAPGQSTSDPFSAGAPDSPGPDAYDADAPDVGSAGLPGTSLIPSLPSGVSQSQLAAYLNAGGPGGVTAGSGAYGATQNLGVVPLPPPGGGSIMPVAGKLLVGPILRAVSQRLGQRVTLGGLVALISKYGFQIAQAITGLDLQTLFAFWLKKKGKRRRRRGITGRQLASAARVARTLHTMSIQFRHACGPGYSSPRRAHSAPPFRRRRRR